MNPTEVVARVRALAEQGYSQREIARLTGRGRSTTYGYLKGHYRPRATTAAEIAPRIQRTPRLRIPTLLGTIFEEVPERRERRRLGRFLSRFVKPLVERGEVGPLRQFQRGAGPTVRVAGGREVRLAVEEEELRRLAVAGELRFDLIYELQESACCTPSATFADDAASSGWG